MESQEQENKSRVVKIESKESWESYLSQSTNQGTPIVAHFTASWCMPSVAMNPFIEGLASTYQEILFSQLTLMMSSHANILLLKDGAQVDKIVGANPDEIKKRIEGLVQSTHVYVA
ncbi:Thioredoxin-like protein CXXS1 [Camellia lanceoleosa]|nr:Thioredoxin-like protein CXXS1 [Camellia lanceoleosa]